MPTAIITGITGQDGAYLAELLLGKNYIVYGTYRRSSSVNFWRIKELGIHEHPNLHLVEYDLTDLSTSIRLLQRSGAKEVYNLAAQSFVGVSFDQPFTTAEITGIGAVHLLEAIRIVDKDIRFYQASTSEMFGKVQAVPQIETTPFYPRSPYGVAKLYAHWMAINYRESDFVTEVKRLTDGRGVDVVLDMVAGAYVARELACMADDGRLVIIAVQGGVKAEIDAGQVLRRRLTVTGSTLRPRPVAFKAAIARSLRETVWPWLEDGRVRPVIHRVFGAEQAADAHALMESNQHIGKLVLTW